MRSVKKLNTTGGVMRLFCCLLLITLTQVFSLGDGVAAEKQTVGWIEKVVLQPEDITLDAKVDTGADNSSLDARNVREIVRDGTLLLRFEVNDRGGRTIVMEREQVGVETVPQHYGESKERPLVIIKVCLGNDCRNTLVNLANRSRLKYPFLVGRSFMLKIVVDPSGEYLVKPFQNEGD